MGYPCQDSEDAQMEHQGIHVRMFYKLLRQLELFANFLRFTEGFEMQFSLCQSDPEVFIVNFSIR